jgi:hypothetical protein
MKPEQLTGHLASLQPRDACSIDYITFRQLFYPGAKDRSARDRCYSFAKSHGCTVVHDEMNQLFCFIRVA